MLAPFAYRAPTACLIATLAVLAIAPHVVAQAVAPLPAPDVIDESALYEPLDSSGLFYDPYRLPVVVPCELIGEHGVLATQYGVIHGETPHHALVPRVGVAGVFGTHTSGVAAHAGVAGVMPLGVNHLGIPRRLTFDVLGGGAANHRQWGYNFAGTETRLYVEVVPELPFLYTHLPQLFDIGRQTNAHLSFGYRMTWFDNNSYDEFSGRPTTELTRHDLLSQRLANLFVQLDFTTDGALLPCISACRTYHRIRIEFENDSVLGGDAGDEFRTHTSRVLYLAQSGQWQMRAGLILEMFTGQVDLDATVPTPDGEFFDTTGLAFNDRSMGFVGVQLGLSHFHGVGAHLGEFGFNATLGADNENVRDVFQNQFVHKWLLDIPQVPLVDRSDRFRFDVSVFYTLHF